jgi:hypothetical protein
MSDESLQGWSVVITGSGCLLSTLRVRLLPSAEPTAM